MTDVTGSGEYYTGIAIGDMGNGKYSASRSLFVNHLPKPQTPMDRPALRDGCAAGNRPLIE